ncbi:MAG TPA: dihydrofolate reductase family protein [Candidatus Limnocylindrales bacterium]
MAKVYTGASMSIDGYISGPDDTGFDQLFKWYSNGDVELEMSTPEIPFKLTKQSAEYFTRVLNDTGALVCGRHLWNFTNAWGGKHPLGTPVVVLTHSVPDGWPQEGEYFTFVTEGIEAAVAKATELANGKNVGLNSGQIASQALEAGLIDEVLVDLVPVLLGAGTPFFSGLSKRPVVLDGPIELVQGKDVTHLRYKVIGQPQ